MPQLPSITLLTRARGQVVIRFSTPVVKHPRKVEDVYRQYDGDTRLFRSLVGDLQPGQKDGVNSVSALSKQTLSIEYGQGKSCLTGRNVMTVIKKFCTDFGLELTDEASMAA
jgi:hypothetical protein